MELKACVLDDLPPGTGPTQECFDAYNATFVRDESGDDMPADPYYPERGYYSGGQSGDKNQFTMVFKLPKGAYGSRVLLQWRYITANSCSPPGYARYFADNNLPGSYWTQGVTTCSVPYPQDGTRSSVWPEQFFNCAEGEFAQ